MREDERLRIDLVVERRGLEKLELRAADICGRQRLLS
jgi:hypothetical protein